MSVATLSVLIPARNEAANLPTLLDEIESALQDIAHEIIVIDDGSTDATWQLLTERATRQSNLRPLRHAISAGQSTSMWQAAWLARGTWLATLDGDGQNDPADLPGMLERARGSEVTLVAGHRTQRHDSWVKRWSSRIANAIRSRLLNDATPDTGCGIRIIERDAFLQLPYFNHMHRFLPALIRMQGGQTLSCAVNHRPRQAGHSNYGTLDRLIAGLADLIGVMWLNHRSRLPAMLYSEPSSPSPDGHPSKPGPTGEQANFSDHGADRNAH
ncbi:glycosyltransferase family 2 protein [Kushneria phosphatilytica]|uniref:Glycosyltransferase family 2 protein n=1 Tax=Kushneria phosphatilytica TaxID=657387 RepID=A0A5C0ZVD4_9GAMM|nr:glycosyltransferase family 2 protein [Kushneria phosphatilytica]QEL10101.1 glycosyltransferase family 2 protein [Kushneria phosphatilytica]